MLKTAPSTLPLLLTELSKSKDGRLVIETVLHDALGGLKSPAQHYHESPERFSRAVGVLAESTYSGLHIIALQMLLDDNDIAELANIIRPFLEARFGRRVA